MSILKTNEKKIFAKLLNQACDELGNNSCNDLELRNTPENLKLVEEACLWNLGKRASKKAIKEELENWVDPYREKDIFGEPIKKTIFTTDFVIFGYLISKLNLNEK
jgi:hypothetical protein